MANYINLSTLQLSKEMVDRASQLAFRASFVDSGMMDLHGITTGVYYAMDMAYSGPSMQIQGGPTSGCGVPGAVDTVGTNTITWNPIITAGRAELCDTQLVSTDLKFLSSANPYTGEDRVNYQYLVNFIVSSLQKEIAHSVFLKAWLSREDAAVYPTGGWAPSYTPYLSRVSEVNGFFKQLENLPSARVLTLTENQIEPSPTPGGNPTVNQNITPQRAFDILNILYRDKATALLRAAAGDTSDPLQYRVSKSIMDGLEDLLGNQEAVVRYHLNTTTSDPRKGMLFRGIPVIEDPQIQTQLEMNMTYDVSVSGDAIMYTKYKNYAILSPKNNLNIGLGDTSSLSSLKIIPVPQDYKSYMDWKVYYDAKILNNDMIAAAI